MDVNANQTNDLVDIELQLDPGQELVVRLAANSLGITIEEFIIQSLDFYLKQNNTDISNYE